MEGDSFVVPGHLPNRWPAHGPPKRFHGNPQDIHSPQGGSVNHQGHFSSNYQNRYSNSHSSGYPSEDATFSNEYGNQFFAQHQGGPIRRQRQWHHYANHGAQNRKPITCGPCNRTFYSRQRMDEHLKDHVECPFPECKLSAHIKVIDQHINNQHMLVNFEALQIDDETWIAERKKRFPTAQRAELRRAEQMEKLKRGERLGLSKKPFDNKKGDKNFKRGKNGIQKGSTVEKKVDQNERCSNNTKEVGETFAEEKIKGNSRFKKQKRDERPPGPRKPSIEVDLFESSDEEVYGVRPFKGTKHFYESTGEMNYFSANHTNRNSAENDIAISDEEEWETEHKDENVNNGTLVLGGALGSLMGAYTDSEEEENADTTALESTVSNERVNSSLQSPLQDTKNTAIEKKDDSQNKGELEPRGKARRRPRVHKKGKGPANAKRPPTRRRRSLLERLLQADIIHERNILLQCVRYIVENNFFDENVKSNKNIEPKGYQDIHTLEEDNQIKEENTEIKLEESSVMECNSVEEINKETDIAKHGKSNKTKDKLHDYGEAVVNKSVDVPEMEVAENKGDNSEVKGGIIQSEITLKIDQCGSFAEDISSSNYIPDESESDSAITPKDSKQNVSEKVELECQVIRVRD